MNDIGDGNCVQSTNLRSFCTGKFRIMNKTQ